VVILLVEPEPLVREMLAASLEIHDRRFRVIALGGADEAIAAARAERPALLVVDPELPGPRRQVDLISALRAASPGVPILGLTSKPQALFRAIPPLEALVEKPPDIDYLLRRVDDLVASHGGVLRDVSLASLLQVLAADRKSCSIAVGSTVEAGKIWLSRGRPCHAVAGERSGREAFFHLLSCDNPLLRVRPDGAPAHSLDDTLQALLLEHSVLIDRRRADGGSPPDKRPA
jgi:CheY-like chemotaxis protein